MDVTIVNCLHCLLLTSFLQKLIAVGSAAGSDDSRLPEITSTDDSLLSLNQNIEVSTQISVTSDYTSNDRIEIQRDKLCKLVCDFCRRKYSLRYGTVCTTQCDTWGPVTAACHIIWSNWKEHKDYNMTLNGKEQSQNIKVNIP